MTGTVLLTMGFTTAFDLSPSVVRDWSAQAAAREAAKPSQTAAQAREAALDAVIAQQQVLQAEADAAAERDARELGGKGRKIPVAGLPPASKGDDKGEEKRAAREAAIAAAQQAAASSKKAVEVTALTSETSRTVANPDGTLTTESALSPVRYRTDGGHGPDTSGKAVWKDVDLTLSGRDSKGRHTPAAAGPWAARLAPTSGARMFEVGPQGSVISWSPQAAAKPVGRGGPGGPLPTVTATAPDEGTAPVTPGVAVEVPPAPGRSGQAPGKTGEAPGEPDEGSGKGQPTDRGANAKNDDTSAGEGTAKADAQARYRGALKGGRDFQVTVTETGAEEAVLLASPAQVAAAGGAEAAAVYRSVFTLPAGVTARQAAPRDDIDASVLGVEFVDAAGAVIATYGGGKAFDSSRDATGEPAVTAVATRLIAASAGNATVEVSIDPAWITDPARVYPLTIDPRITAATSFSTTTGANGSASVDAYIDEAFPSTAQGVQDSSRLLVGPRWVGSSTPNTRSLLRFDLGELEGSENTVLSANLSLHNTGAVSCTPSTVRISAVSSAWNPSTVTWFTAPASSDLYVLNKYAHGASTACPAQTVPHDVTPIVQRWSNGTAGHNQGVLNHGFIISAEFQNNTGFKQFTAGEAATDKPALKVTWENCTNYPEYGNPSPYKVCGEFRPLMAKNGSVYGYPTGNEQPTADGTGRYQNFGPGNYSVDRSMYWSAATGAHRVGGPIRTKWLSLGAERGRLGYPATSTGMNLSEPHQRSEFRNPSDGSYRSIASSPCGAFVVEGPIRDKWASLEWTAIGYPMSDAADTHAGGKSLRFVVNSTTGCGGPMTSIFWHPSTGAHAMGESIRSHYDKLGGPAGWLGYPTSDEFTPIVWPAGGPVPDGARQVTFEHGTIYAAVSTVPTAVMTAGSMTTPLPRQSTARRLPVGFTLKADVAGRMSMPVLEFRRGLGLWQNVPTADLVLTTGQSAPASLPSKLLADGRRVLDVPNERVYWDVYKTLGGVGGMVDVRFRFTDSQTTTDGSPTQVPLNPVAGIVFDPEGGQAPALAVGPGSVNALTGAFTLSSSDASAFGVSVTRTYNSRRLGAGHEDAQASAFGPQWTLAAVDDDLATAWTAIRQTGDTTLSLVDAGGTAIHFVRGKDNTWQAEPGQEDLILAGTLAGNAASTIWTLTDGDGTVTTFGHAVVNPAPPGVVTTAATRANLQAVWSVALNRPGESGDFLL
ncbi:DNRLRE domain-containing protein [Kineococcus xinjiangensis]|uniref:DNRLRE domain-containing protein n=1 Tax=Kineococcus xinjiangensis TaxID=512762 RepID=UPI000CEC0A92|nr:DNRLRE domain-containing protein [Kineococcus xinjiangensis]